MLLSGTIITYLILDHVGNSAAGPVDGFHLVAYLRKHNIFTLLVEIGYKEGTRFGEVCSWVGIHGCSRFYKFGFQTCTNFKNLL